MSELERSQLRVSYVWRDEVMADRVLLEDGSIVLGSDRSATFTTPDLGLPASFEVIRPGARGYLLTLGASMTGRMRLDGEEIDVAEFMRRGGGGAAEGAQGSFRATSIGPGDWGVVHLDGSGNHNLFFQFVKADPPLPPSRWRDSELLLPAFAFAIMLASVFLMVAFQFKPDHAGMVFPGKREMVAGYLVSRPPPPPEPEKEQPRPGELDSKEKEPPSSTKGAEGKAGGEGQKERKRAPDPDKGAPDQTIPKSVEVGLLSKSSRETIKKTLDRGGFDEKLGKALARMQGPLNDGTMGGNGPGKGTGFGPGEGTGTLTKSSGKGTGGGGNNLGDVQTQKAIKTGGTHAVHGVPGGTGVKEVEVKVSTGTASGDLGGLTPAEILKVVNSRRNGFRTCYERELQRNKGLGGKVVISWKINSAGKVLDARVSKSSMHSGTVEDCLVRQVSSLHFPSPRNGSTAKVNFPFLFAPR